MKTRSSDWAWQPVEQAQRPSVCSRGGALLWGEQSLGQPVSTAVSGLHPPLGEKQDT